MQCVQCNGSGCEPCKQIGKLRITRCPLLEVTRDIWEVIDLAELWEKGIPPVAGGVLDQTKGFVDAARFVFAEQRYFKKLLKIIE